MSGLFDFDWTKWTKSVIQLFTRQEVKTPLAYFFRIAFYTALILGLSLFAPATDQFKIWLVKVAMAVLGGMFVLVMLFAWFNAKNLVYGESGHRAEHKLLFGTEQKTMDRAEVESLPGTGNPKRLESGKDLE